MGVAKIGDRVQENGNPTNLANINGNRKEGSKMVKRSELVSAAKELNSVLGLEPAIDIRAKPEVLTIKLQEAAGLLDLEQDKLTDTTLAVIEVLGYGQSEDVDTEAPEPDDAPDPASVSEDSGVEEEEEELLQVVTRASKLADLKILVSEHDEFKQLRGGLDAYKGLSGPRELKTAMMAALGVVIAAPSPKKTDSTPRKKSGVGLESFENLVKRLFAAGKDDAAIVKEFAAVYRDRKGEAEDDFLRKRASAYINIAKKANKAPDS